MHVMTPTLVASRTALPPEGTRACLGRPGAAHPYQITITMLDGSQGSHHGLYADGFDAVIRAMDSFPNAHRVSARRLS